MGTYYNFSYLDLDKVKSPEKDLDDIYVLGIHKSYESLWNAKLYKTTNNYLVSDCFSKVVDLKNNETEFINKLKFAFGNMFWHEVLSIKNQKIKFCLNFWDLKWIPSKNRKYIGFLDWYSIHQDDIKLVLDELNKIDLNKYYKLCQQVNNLSLEDEELNRTVIQEWIKMYETAIKKSKGIVYDIG